MTPLPDCEICRRLVGRNLSILPFSSNIRMEEKCTCKACVLLRHLSTAHPETFIFYLLQQRG